MAVNSNLYFSEGGKGIVVDEFSDDEAAVLNRYVTNIDGNVFAYKISNELDHEQVGALLSRYSRTSFTGRRLFLKEFLPNRDRGREFFEAWLVDFGDDSIQEMAGGIPVCCEYVSNLAAKGIEDSRMGSYIEKSTRYVFFDKRLRDGEFMFYRDPDILESRYGDEYMGLMRGLFGSYIKHVDAMSRYIEERNPFDSQSFRIGDETLKPSELTREKEERLGVTEVDIRKSYDNSIKANALDFMRDYLPMSTLTHVGISMNARSYDNVMNKTMSSQLAETRWIGRRIFEELDKMVPSLVRRTMDKHGEEQRRLLSEVEMRSIDNARSLLSGLKPEKGDSSVNLVQYTGMGSGHPDEQAQNNIASAILYRFGEGHSMRQTRSVAESVGAGGRMSLISGYVGERRNRRDRPGRAFENVEYLFDLRGRIGIYRDLQRHRIGTQERPRFTVKLGYNTRSEYTNIGIEDDYRSKMQDVEELYGKLEHSLPYQAQYVVAFGFDTRWYYRLNARQLFHLCELRTQPAGHPDYRKLVRDMYLQVKGIHPTVTEHMGFVDLGEKQLGRLSSEIRIAQKRKRAPA